jgi:hypothetical protein
MFKYQDAQKDQEVALREAMRRDAARWRRNARLQDQLKGRGPVLSTQQFITDPAARRDDYMAVPYAVARVRR